MRKLITISSDHEGLKPWLENIADNFNNGGELIYDARNQIKVFRKADLPLYSHSTDINVKRYHAPRYFNSLVYSYGLREPKGCRAYKYAKVLLDKGISTHKPIAYIEERNAFGILGYSYLITEQINYDMRMYEVGDAKPGSYEALAKQLAAFAADMHQKEVLHLDFSPGNILVNIEDKNSPIPIYHFTIVDINRMRFGTVTIEDACKNFARLWGPKRFMQILIKEYCAIRNFDAVKAETLLMQERRKFWKLYMSKHEMEFKPEL